MRQDLQEILTLLLRTQRSQLDPEQAQSVAEAFREGNMSCLATSRARGVPWSSVWDGRLRNVIIRIRHAFRRTAQLLRPVNNLGTYYTNGQVQPWNATAGGALDADARGSGPVARPDAPTGRPAYTGAFGGVTRRGSLNGTQGRPPAASPFHRGHRAHRARFWSADNEGARNLLRQHDSGSGGGSGGGSGARKRRTLWQRILGNHASRSVEEALQSPQDSQSISFTPTFDSGGGAGGTGGVHPVATAGVPDTLQMAFDPDYDTSRPHLVKLFNSLDTNGSGTITYESMRMGLANLGTYSDLNYLIGRADMDKSKEISLDAFVETVQDYAAKILASKLDLPVRCFVYDYSTEDVSFRWLKTRNSSPPLPSVPLEELMAERPEDKAGSVRWVCVTGSDPSLVIHMANRYGIHPLQVEDCLSRRERFKVDAFRAPLKTAPASPTPPKSPLKDDATTSAVSARSRAAPPRSSTQRTAERGLEEDEEEWYEEAMKVRRAASDPGPATLSEQDDMPPAGVSTAASDGKEDDTAAAASDSRRARPSLQERSPINGVDRKSSIGGDVTKRSPQSAGVERRKKRVEDILHVVLGRISLRSPTAGRPSNLEREQVSIFLIGDHTVLFIEPKASGVSDQISNRIYYAGSKLRLNNARYLVYSLMDTIVDDVFPIMQHFQAWLVQLQGKLHSVDDGPSLEVVRAIQQVSRDMHMITYYLRPMKMVAVQLITDLPGNDPDLKRHVEDLRDHLLMLEEQAMRMLTWSRSLNKDWVNEQQHRMNQVVYILTMVTSAFMPAQFLTGVFGMNFKFMPELNWRYSYATFWVLVALLAYTSYHVYKRHKWL